MGLLADQKIYLRSLAPGVARGLLRLPEVTPFGRVWSHARLTQTWTTPIGGQPSPRQMPLSRRYDKIRVWEVWLTTTLLEELQTFGPRSCPRLSYEQAAAYTRRLAKTHYENFSVVSWFLPKRLRDDFRNIYAFCRWADDLGDETGDRDQSLELLSWWQTEIDRCYEGQPRHPVFVALYPTIQRHEIPRRPFDDLVDAFIQDQKVVRYDTWDQVLDYCTRSANPVGRLVLYICGHRDDHRQALSDVTCTALQLANFWQDVRRDILERDRVYIPAQIAAKHGLEIETMVKAVEASSDHPGRPQRGCCGADRDPVGLHAVRGPLTSTMKDLVDRTWPLFEQGKALWPLVDADIRLDIRLFTAGGESVLRMIERQGYDTLTRRPVLSKAAKAVLMFRALAGRLLPGGGSGGNAGGRGIRARGDGR